VLAVSLSGGGGGGGGAIIRSKSMSSIKKKRRRLFLGGKIRSNAITEKFLFLSSQIESKINERGRRRH